MREFEFERSWPSHLEFIGPLWRPPFLPRSPPVFEMGKRHVLFTLGTHVEWARQTAAELVGQVAARMPDCVFHCSRGKPGGTEVERRNNVHVYDFLPYTDHLGRYDAAIIHGGTGILYACIEQAVPCLVWPQDYDHFDHAARIVHRGLGLPFEPQVNTVVDRLEQLFGDKAIQRQLKEFQERSQEYDPVNWFHREVTARWAKRGLGGG
jgi:UDP:flavonoid glycosyltransferase YjiC (YdhE family)